MAEIVDFTERKEAAAVEELERDINDADDIVDDLIVEMSELFDSYGMVERNEYIAKDLFFVMEAIRSFVYGYMKIDHTFHHFIQKMVEVEYDEVDDVYNVHWKKPLDTVEEVD